MFWWRIRFGTLWRERGVPPRGLDGDGSYVGRRVERGKVCADEDVVRHVFFVVGGVVATEQRGEQKRARCRLTLSGQALQNKTRSQTNPKSASVALKFTLTGAFGLPSHSPRPGTFFNWHSGRAKEPMNACLTVHSNLLEFRS